MAQTSGWVCSKRGMRSIVAESAPSPRSARPCSIREEVSCSRAMVYDQLAQEANWVTVECFSANDGKNKTPEQIHQAVLEAVDSRVLSRVAPS